MYDRVATLFVPNYKTPTSDGNHRMSSLVSEYMIRMEVMGHQYSVGYRLRDI